MNSRYEQLDLYKTADELTLEVYRATKSFPKEELFGLVSQMRRAAVSVAANFVEGYGRKGRNEKLQFYQISLGSLNELGYFLSLSHKLKYLEGHEFQKLSKLQDSCIKLFQGYIKAIKNSNYQLQTTNSQSGQTLIETVVAVFILASGLSAGLALAVFAFSSSSNNIERVAATSLAREGIEVIRRMRDSNWLRDNLVEADSNTCDEYLAEGEPCFERWLDRFYNINGSRGSGANRRVVFNPTSLDQNKWQINSSSSYRLYLQSGGGFGHSSSGGATQTNFFRKMTIINQNESSARDESQILIRSTVWWYGRRCNNTLINLTNPNQTRCKVIVEDYLTNWKNYEL